MKQFSFTLYIVYSQTGRIAAQGPQAYISSWTPLPSPYWSIVGLTTITSDTPVRTCLVA